MFFDMSTLFSSFFLYFNDWLTVSTVFWFPVFMSKKETGSMTEYFTTPVAHFDIIPQPWEPPRFQRLGNCMILCVHSVSPIWYPQNVSKLHGTTTQSKTKSFRYVYLVVFALLYCLLLFNFASEQGCYYVNLVRLVGVSFLPSVWRLIP